MRDYKFREGNRIVSLFLGACSRTIKFESRLFPQITQVPYVTQKRFLSFFHLYQNTFDIHKMRMQNKTLVNLVDTFFFDKCHTQRQRISGGKGLGSGGKGPIAFK